jgi:hypothetical protein
LLVFLGVFREKKFEGDVCALAERKITVLWLNVFLATQG